MSQMTPREIVEELDKHIIGQKAAKRAVAIALRNRWRRQQVAENLRPEITPKNILMIGPTGVGKTEIARRLARLAKAPFIKVEATKFTEVGYVGREVDSIVRDLVEISVKITREEEIAKVRHRAADAAEERILDALLPRAQAGFTADGPARDIIAALRSDRVILVGHSMGGRNAMLLTRRDAARLHALVVVDVGPEVSDRGRQVIAGFVRDNEEFDDLEHFVRNVQQYDPYRSREHIERTVKYNMLQRADGKFVSKCDATPRRLGLVRGSGPLENITLEDAVAFRLPVLVVRGANSRILAADAAERFRDALPNGTLMTVPDCGHNVHGQNTKGFIEALTGFLATLA